MKTKILIVGLLLTTLLFFGCTQNTDTNKTNETENNTIDTNMTNEVEVFEQEINTNWVNENENIDTGSVI